MRFLSLPAGDSLPPEHDARSLRWRAWDSPEQFYPVAGRLLPILAWCAFAACATGAVLGALAPASEAAGEATYRIVFLHAPAQWVARALYLLMGSCAALALATGLRLPALLVRAIAPTGAMFAVIGLWTGALWAKASWGNWWDPRLTAELTLVLLYAGTLALHSAIEDADGSLWFVLVPSVAVVGILAAALASPVPWSRLHLLSLRGIVEGRTATGDTIVAIAMLGAGFVLYAGAIALRRLRCLILERERDSDWAANATQAGR